MKLAFVVKGGLHPSGQREVVPAWLALFERLARSHEVHAFAVQHLEKPSTYDLRGFTVHDLGRPAGRWAKWTALRDAVRRTGPFDLFHGFWPDVAGFLTMLAGRRFGVPSVVTCDSGEFVGLDDIEYGMQRTIGQRALVSATCRFATRVHVTSHYMEELARARGYRTTRIPIGVDLSRFRRPRFAGDAAGTAVAGPSTSLGSTLSLSKGGRDGGRSPWNLLQVATLSRVKDQATLLRALALVRRELDVELNLVGEDTLGGALHAHAERLGVSGLVAFHGFTPFDELPRFYDAAHLYVQSSRHEAAAAAVLDAAAAGVPIVGTRVGYVADWAPDAAVAVDSCDAGALAHAIIDTLRDRELRARMARNARAFAERHDVDWSASQLGSLYADLKVRAP